jgi:hypothetical protein
MNDSHVNPAEFNNQALNCAVIHDNDNIFRLLLQDIRVTIPVFDNNDLFKACKNGSKYVAMILKDRNVNPSFDNNLAFIEAIKKGHYDVVKILLQDARIDPSINNN